MTVSDYSEKSRLKRVQAKKCRELAAIVENQGAQAILNEYAAELELRASQIEENIETRRSSAGNASRHAM